MLLCVVHKQERRARSANALGGSARHAQRKAARSPFPRHSAASASGFRHIVAAKSSQLDISPFYSHVSVKEARSL